jgi:6-phosphogluconolactonase (cycloisomerase 2 family)
VTDTPTSTPTSTPIDVLTLLEVLSDGGGAGAVQLRVSPEGAEVYVAGSAGSVVGYRRDDVSGLLSLIDVQRSGVGAVSGLECGATSIAIGPDGGQVYVGGRASFCSLGTIATFARDAMSGTLTFADIKLSFTDGVGGIRNAESIALSPNSAHVYVSAFSDNSLSVFQRNAATGRIEFLESQVDGASGVDGLAGIQGVVLSPSGGHVYTVSQSDRAVTTFRRDPGNGRLSFSELLRGGVGGIDGLDFPNAVALSADGASLYVSGGSDAVVAFARDLFTGALTYQRTYRNGFEGINGMSSPIAIEIPLDGSNVYVGTGEQTIVVFARDPQGGLQYLAHERNGVEGVVGLEFPRSIGASPDGAQLYAVSSNGGVVIFNRSPATGALTYVETERVGLAGIDGLNGASGIALSPNGANLYAVGIDDHALGVFRRDPVGGRLVFLEAIRDGNDGADGLAGARGVAVSPDGHHVYVTGSEDDAVAILRRDAALGTLVPLGMVRDGIGGVDGLNGARALVISDDGAHLYAAAAVDNAVSVFGRDAQNGQLEFLQVLRDGVGGVDGLDLARGLTLCPGGAHVYAVGEFDDAVAGLARNPGSGLLTFLAANRDGVAGVDGLDGASAIACSPDGANVYVTGRFDDAVSVFQRNPVTGELSFVEAERNGINGVTGLKGASAVAVSPAGTFVLVAGLEADSVAVFQRELATGSLTFVEVRGNFQQFLYDAPVAMVFGPDSRHLYVAGQDSDSLSAFGFNR